jgi:hypothetical protein
MIAGVTERQFWPDAFVINQVVIPQTDWWPSIALVIDFLDRVNPELGIKKYRI